MTIDRTVAPSDMLSDRDGGLNIFADDASQFRKQPRQPYKLNLQENTFNNMRMEELDRPPRTNMLGGVSQSQNNAPVQFYKFTNKQKRQLRQEMYQDPFNPLATEEEDMPGVPSTQRPAIPPRTTRPEDHSLRSSGVRASVGNPRSVRQPPPPAYQKQRNPNNAGGNYFF